MTRMSLTSLFVFLTLLLIIIPTEYKPKSLTKGTLICHIKIPSTPLPTCFYNICYDHILYKNIQSTFLKHYLIVFAGQSNKKKQQNQTLKSLTWICSQKSDPGHMYG